MAMMKNNSLLGYAQILQIVADRIVDGVYQEGGRVPSVRELAVEMEVNPITITRAYDRLQLQGAIYVQRGMGYYVADGAVSILRKARVEHFWNEELPRLKSTMTLLGISTEELLEQLNQIS